MYVIVYLRKNPSEDKGLSFNSVQSSLAGSGWSIAPLHPGAEDEDLARQFFVEVTDAQQGQMVQDQLSKLDEVEAVYTKPPEGPPS
ncbi:hypothetical protein Pan97_02790 [Bremerella volcania]|uniref:Uncharacterized protein n=1 Tax=Bremerella volcania TaxID=2527984 RepID=A0A518C261_9BACT|nr:hypothetical protein Pan97_02790 [Bremerella volcania]